MNSFSPRNFINKQISLDGSSKILHRNFCLTARKSIRELGRMWHMAFNTNFDSMCHMWPRSGQAIKHFWNFLVKTFFSNSFFISIFNFVRILYPTALVEIFVQLALWPVKQNLFNLWNILMKKIFMFFLSSFMFSFVQIL